MGGLRFRKAVHFLMMALICVATILALLPLISVFLYVLRQGIPGLDLDFFTSLPKPVGESGGGMGNALAGTATLLALACIIGLPWGIAAGVFLSEFGEKSRLVYWVRLASDILGSVPSIVIGLFVYAILVKPMGRFSAIAGGLALGIIIVPSVTRTTEELLKLMPGSVREAGLALGIPRWRVVLEIVLKGSRGSVLTGVMLSIARAAGETAPLLFTAFNNRFWQKSLDQPIASLPVQIYNYAISPFDDWHRQAWAGAFLLVLSVFLMNLLTRFIFGSFSAKARE